MNRILLISISLLLITIPCHAQFIDAGFGNGPFGIKQFYTGLFGTGVTGSGGITPNGELTFNGKALTFNGSILTYTGN